MASVRAWLRAILIGLLAALPFGVTLALLRRSIALYLAANEYRRALLDHAVDGMIVIDDDGHVHAFNPAAEKIFAYRAEEMLGQSLQRIVAPPDHVLYKLISIGREATGIRKGGVTFPMDMTSGQMQLGGRRMYLLIVRDVTRRKQIEDELRAARDAAEAASRAKSAFMLAMSHELRTPLNHIIGYGEMVQEELAERGSEDLIPDMQRIEQSGRQLLRQIEDVLDLANIDSGVMQLWPTTFAIEPLLGELREAVTPLLEKHQNTLEILCDNPPLSITADRERVRQVLINVLSNACKFTEAGHVRLRVATGAAGAHPLALFEISDTGIGMSDEQLGRLFEAFNLQHVTTRTHSGAGLGMAIAQRLCRLMGGEVRATSALGQGTTFIVQLPIGQRQDTR
jgi:PAS domain S-box-containing protein